MKTTKPKATYLYDGGQVDLDGWYKIHLIRNDGKQVKVSKSRFRQLKIEGRVTFPQ